MRLTKAIKKEILDSILRDSEIVKKIDEHATHMADTLQKLAIDITFPKGNYQAYVKSCEEVNAAVVINRSFDTSIHVGGIAKQSEMSLRGICDPSNPDKRAYYTKFTIPRFPVSRHSWWDSGTFQTDEWKQTYTSLRDQYNSLLKKKAELVDKINGVLSRCTTRKQLIELWAEAEPYIPEPPKPAKPPMVPIHSLNQEIGIPKEKK